MVVANVVSKLLLLLQVPQSVQITSANLYDELIHSVSIANERLNAPFVMTW